MALGTPDRKGMVGQFRIPQICIFTPMVIAFVFLAEMGFDGRNVSALLSSNLVSIKLNSVDRKSVV